MADETTRTTEEVIHEYPTLSERFRPRVLRKTLNGSTCLDIREYLKTEKFEGFTRRGIRLASREDLEKLRDLLNDALGRGWFGA